MGRSRGTLPVQLAGNIKHGGLIELAFGVTLRDILYEYGGGSASGRPIKAVQVGGPLGAYLPESQWDTPLDYEAFAALWAVLGHGGIVVHDDSADMSKLARYAMEFCAVESCGKCTPCRIGSTRGVEVIDKITANQANASTANVQGHPAARTVRHHAARLAVCDGRYDAVPRAVGPEPLPARFRPGR
jgi:formate dehydrogenase iron-sulfur subunit